MNEIRLIDANALKERYKTMLKIIGKDNLLDFEQGKKYAFETAIDFIDNAPTVEPKRPQGKWLEHENYIECDQCHMRFLKDHLIRKRYCSNCGADMRGEKK